MKDEDQAPAPADEATPVPKDETESKQVEVAEDSAPEDAQEKATGEEASELTKEQEDAEIEEAFKEEVQPDEQPKKPGIFKRFWAHKKLRYTLLISLLTITGVMIFVPTARFATLNLFGVRGQVVVTVKDSETQQPLKDVSVNIDGKNASTNEEGKATIDSVKLGSQNLGVTKAAYELYNQTVTVATGTTNVDNVALVPTGTPYTFTVTDWVSGEPIVKAEVSYQESSAFSDDKGSAQLTVPPLSEAEFTVTVKADGYRQSEVKVLASDSEATKVKLVPAAKRVFISKRGGVYDVYKSDLDGKREKKLVAGTGKERDDLNLTVNYDANKAVLVSSRDGKRNSRKELMDGMFVVDLDSGELTKVAEAYTIQLVGWVGDNIVYTKYSYLASANKRYILSSYNVANNTSATIANASSFSDVLTTSSYVFYIPSGYDTPSIKPYLYRADPDGGNKTVIRSSETWSVLRQGSNSLIISAPDNKWFESDVTGASLTTLDGPPPRAYRSVSHLYVPSPNSNDSLWVDQRDGKGVLLLHKSGESDSDDVVLARQSGLRTPIAWLNDSLVIFRVSTDQETADYVVSTKGGEAKKISDVSDIGAEDRYYYYYD